MSKENQKLSGQTSIITGSSSGIGKAMAIALAKEGSNVVINYHSSKEDAEEVAQKISEEKGAGEAIVVQGDMSKEEDVLNLFKTTIDKFGTLDVCIPNAGMQKDAAFHEMTLDDWNAVINLNLTGQFLCCREAIKEFMRRGMRPEVSKSLGKIINMSSVHDIVPWAGHANYAASKGGIQLLMKTLCQEYASKKVRVNSISPGAIKTDINKDVWETKEGREKMKETIPYDQIGEPDDIGRVAAWLASDESEYINGTTIYVDGGMTCYPGFKGNG